MRVFSLVVGQYRWTHIEYELLSVQNSCPTNLASWVDDKISQWQNTTLTMCKRVCYQT